MEGNIKYTWSFYEACKLSLKIHKKFAFTKNDTYHVARNIINCYFKYETLQVFITIVKS